MDFELRFSARVEVVEVIEADTQEAALEKAQQMINNRTIGEHQLDIDWTLDHIQPVDSEVEREGE